MKTGVVSAWIACGLIVLAVLVVLDLAGGRRPMPADPMTAVAPSALGPHACGQPDPSQSVPALACVPPLHREHQSVPPFAGPPGVGPQ